MSCLHQFTPMIGIHFECAHKRLTKIIIARTVTTKNRAWSEIIKMRPIVEYIIEKKKKRKKKKC